MSGSFRVSQVLWVKTYDGQRKLSSMQSLEGEDIEQNLMTPDASLWEGGGILSQEVVFWENIRLKLSHYK